VTVSTHTFVVISFSDEKGSTQIVHAYSKTATLDDDVFSQHVCTVLTSVSHTKGIHVGRMNALDGIKRGRQSERENVFIKSISDPV